MVTDEPARDLSHNIRASFSMETENASIEEQYFDNIFRNTNVNLNKTLGGNEILVLTETDNVGSNIILSVMPGDEIDLDVWCAYQAGDYSSTYGLAAMINAVAGAFGGVSGAGGESGAIYDAINEGLTALGLGGTQGSSQPAAYLNYLVFDKNLNYLFGGYTETVDNNQGVMQQFNIPDIFITQPGYIYVYLSNESSNTTKLILFDEMNLTLTRPILQVADYYPFGMAMAENSYENVLETKNRYKYNGIEEQDDFRLNTFMAEFRMFDPTIGRWWQIDPYDKEDLTPYGWVTNNPILYADPLGLDSVKYDDLDDVPFDPEKDVVILDEVTVTSTYTGSKPSDSPNIRYALESYYDPNAPLASGAVEPIYFIPNPIEAAISFIDNISRGEFIMAGVAGLALIPSGKTIRGAIKAVGLPVTGKIRFVPPKSWNPSMGINALKRKGGYVDRFGNIWTKKKVAGKAAGEIHWDVQLSPKGKSQLGHLSNSGNHLNITPLGKISH